MIVVISLTVDRKKKWSCATSSSPTHAAYAFEDAAQIFFRATGRSCEVAHSWRTEPLRPAEKRRDHLPGSLVFGRQLDLVRRKSDERAVQNETA